MARSSRHRFHPLRANRTQVQTYQEDSDSQPDEDGESYEESGFMHSTVSLRPRNSQVSGSYREDSTDGSCDEQDDADDSDNRYDADDANNTVLRDSGGQIPFVFLPLLDSFNSQTTRARRRATTKSKSNGRKRPANSHRLEPGRPLFKRKKVDIDDSGPVSSGVIPPWQTLPYHVLLDIFYYASHPHDFIAWNDGIADKWLLRVALLCRAFHEPALAALYYSPPLFPSSRSHGLLSLLCKPQNELSINYASKIKELDIDVEKLLTYKSSPIWGYFDLSQLIERTPQLKALRLYHEQDYYVGYPEYEIPHSRKWLYPAKLWSSLHRSVRLRRFEWNARFISTNELLPLMMAEHAESSFHGLRILRLLHVGCENIQRGEGSPNDQETELAMALMGLPDLRRLDFFECPVLNDHLFPNLPPKLTHLTITNCEEVSSANLAPFLATHGEHLEELVLNHNRYLGLSFTAGLAESCKNLQRLKMDMTIYDRSSYHNTEPYFKELIGVAEFPTWPASLQEIELVQLRKWDNTSADVFFNSLVEATPQLRDLRKLVISAILRIGWRDRATFRRKWIDTLRHVFQRRSKPPCDIRTLRNPELVNASMANGNGNETGSVGDDRLTSAQSTPSKRQSSRIAQRIISEAEDEMSALADNDTRRHLPIQGMCDIVSVRIDNQRPSDTQFNENDFLDDELSGDEDWDAKNDADTVFG